MGVSMGKPAFEVESVRQAVAGGKTNMYEARVIVRHGKKGRPKKEKFVVFGQDEMAAYLRATEVMKERNRDAQEQTEQAQARACKEAQPCGGGTCG
jgi:hypothetical protein